MLWGWGTHTILLSAPLSSRASCVLFTSSNFYLKLHAQEIFFFLERIHLGLCWAFVAACGLSLAAGSRAAPWAGSKGCPWLWDAGSSLWWLLRLRNTGSEVQAKWLRRGSSCRGMWNLPGVGMELTSPALAGRFSNQWVNPRNDFQ